VIVAEHKDSSNWEYLVYFLNRNAFIILFIGLEQIAIKALYTIFRYTIIIIGKMLLFKCPGKLYQILPILYFIAW
jgi:lipopolysaccharide export LptBFGC system permease protein LptF